MTSNRMTAQIMKSALPFDTGGAPLAVASAETFGGTCPGLT